MEVHHIVDWAEVKEHIFDNLIYLCAVCHARATKGEIDRLSMLQYKANLGVLGNRYGDFERRVLEMFTVAKVEPSLALILPLPGGRDLDLLYLLRDGLLVKTPTAGNILVMGIPAREEFRLTPLGVEFVKKLRAAEPVE